VLISVSPNYDTLVTIKCSVLTSAQGTEQLMKYKTKDKEKIKKPKKLSGKILGAL